MHVNACAQRVQHQSELTEAYENLGFANYLIMRRFFDLNKELEKICLDPSMYYDSVRIFMQGVSLSLLFSNLFLHFLSFQSILRFFYDCIENPFFCLDYFSTSL